jgi:hypothetical protein
MEDDDQTRKSPIRPDPEVPNSRSPHSRFGRETGRESPIPDSAEIRNREIPPAFPDSAGTRTGNRGPGTKNRGPAGGTAGDFPGGLVETRHS